MLIVVAKRILVQVMLSTANEIQGFYRVLKNIRFADLRTLKIIFQKNRRFVAEI